MAQYSTVLIMTHFEHITPTRPWHDAENTSMKDARWRSKARSAWTGITSRLTRIIARVFVLRSIVNRFTAIRSLIANMRPRFVEKRKKEKGEKKKSHVAYFANISICYQYVDSRQCSRVRINSIYTMKKQYRRTIYGCDFFSLIFFYFEFLFFSFYIFIIWIRHFRKWIYSWLNCVID